MAILADQDELIQIGQATVAEIPKPVFYNYNIIANNLKQAVHEIYA